ncbi:CKL8 [Symbiodinium sp. CCMP2592]|nr:CKL8 [Symbiodinium sp. CCMP2592]
MAETAITSQLLEEAGLSLEFQEEGTRLVIRAGGGPKRSAGAEVVAALLKADRRIRALDLRHSQLNDNGLAQISLVVRQTDQLEELHCHPVGHTGLQFLLGLVRRCSRLRILSVEVCDCPTLFVGRQTLAPADFDTSDYTAPKVEVEDEVEDPEEAEAKAAAQVEKLRQLFAENDYDSGDETAPKEEPSGAGVLRKLLQELAKAVRETPSLSSVDCFGEMVPWDVKLDITRAAEEHQAQKQKRLAESQEAGSRTASDVMKDQMAEITSILQHMQESGIEGVLPGEEASQKPTFLPIRSYIARRLHSALGEALFECERFKSKENKALDTPQGEMAFLAMCAKPPSTVANGRYQIEKKLGAGCFGEVWQGRDKQTNEKVAVKFEDSSGHALQLEHEQAVLKLMAQPRRPQGFAELFWCGQEQRFMCLVMEMLGKSLEDRLQGLGGQGNPPRFNPQTAVLVADQVLRRIEYLHSKGIVHRDIKPENFMFGIKSRVHHLYLIDFGLSKKYFDQKHVALRTQLSLTGTARYASINAHKGVEQSRRDDLEADPELTSRLSVDEMGHTWITVKKFNHINTVSSDEAEFAWVMVPAGRYPGTGSFLLGQAAKL